MIDTYYCPSCFRLTGVFRTKAGDFYCRYCHKRFGVKMKEAGE